KIKPCAATYVLVPLYRSLLPSFARLPPPVPQSRPRFRFRFLPPLLPPPSFTTATHPEIRFPPPFHPAAKLFDIYHKPIYQAQVPDWFIQDIAGLDRHD
ncbi:hypothetical protein L211DRAFT_862861, partial [Terfezia boudieri ATCC MYA-4762]